MKFNIEVEIDWLGEGGDLDGAVKEQLLEGIVAHVSKDFVKDITEKAMQRVNATLDTLVTNLFNGFMDKGITITDRWGDPIENNIKVETIIKSRMDKALTEKVDRKSGNPTDYNGIPRLEYMLHQRVDKAMAKMTTEVVAQVDTKIAATINDQIKARLSESLLGKIDVDSIVKKTLEGLQK